MIHGGDVFRNSIKLDFSVNVNPLGIPARAKKLFENSADAALIYPDPEKMLLNAAIAEHHNVRSANVLAGNGSSELFMAIVHSLRPQNILIPVPSFYGYEYVANACNAYTEYYERGNEYGLGEKFMNVLTNGSRDWDMVFLSCPNNPTGLMITIPVLQRILELCEDYGIYCVLDLCFLELTDEYEEYEKFFNSHVYPHLIRVYAFTKTYAMPGLRLGYLIAEESLSDSISIHLPEWNISTIAQLAGVACLDESQYIAESREFIRRERAWMRDELKALDIDTYASRANFIFAMTPSPIYDMLLRRRILIRDCSNFRGVGSGFYRIALRNHEDNKKLLSILREELEQQ